jgi:hypothetical protein
MPRGCDEYVCHPMMVVGPLFNILVQHGRSSLGFVISPNGHDHSVHSGYLLTVLLLGSIVRVTGDPDSFLYGDQRQSPIFPSEY